jgi:hypothetical protein
MFRSFLSTTTLLSVVLVQSASAASIELKSTKVEYPTPDVLFPGAGTDADAINNNCLACHSADHVLNQPFLSKENWEEVVHKMITAYKAPISPDDAKQIVDYLVKTKSPP